MIAKPHKDASAALILLVAAATLVGSAATARASELQPCQSPLDAPPSSGPPQLKPTTITTIGQAYYCILENYYRGPILDDRLLLVQAFAGLTQELQRRGLDQPDATLPPLSGKIDPEHRRRNWAAFRQVYEQITQKLPQDPALHQALAEATMHALVDSLNDNHAAWARGAIPDLTGLRLSVTLGAGNDLDPAATEPLFVTAAGGASRRAGIRPGDEIVAVNGVPPYANGVPSAGVLTWITQARIGTPVQLTLHRPATDATFTVTLMPGGPPSPPPADDSRLVDGNVAYVKLRDFGPGAAGKVLNAIATLRQTATLRGLILDLRANAGGSDEEVARLLGAFAHDAVWSYWCDAKDHCRPNRTDNSVPLLELPLVALTDRHCASACDAFAGAVKDLHLGTLVGTRSAGHVSGVGFPYVLDDGTLIQLPKRYQIETNGEIINNIGVAVDYYAPLTAADLSAGRDPGLDQAVALLR